MTIDPMTATESEQPGNQIALCCCPKCHRETLRVSIERGGQGIHPEYGTVYWFEGQGKCSESDCEPPQ